MPDSIAINEWRGDADGTLHRAEITVLQAVLGAAYTIRLDQLLFTYRALDGDTLETIADQLGQLLSANQNFTTSVNGNVITLIGREDGVPFAKVVRVDNVPASVVSRVQAGAAALPQESEITLPATTTGGTWRYSFNGGDGWKTTADVAHTVSAAGLKSAIETAAPGVTVDVALLQSSPRTYRIKWRGDYAGLTVQTSANGNGLTGNASASISTIQTVGGDTPAIWMVNFLPSSSSSLINLVVNGVARTATQAQVVSRTWWDSVLSSPTSAFSAWSRGPDSQICLTLAFLAHDEIDIVSGISVGSVQKVQSFGGGVNDCWQLVLPASSTGVELSRTYTFDGQTTSAIVQNASQLLAALKSLSNIEDDEVERFMFALLYPSGGGGGVFVPPDTPMLIHYKSGLGASAQPLLIVSVGPSPVMVATGRAPINEIQQLVRNATGGTYRLGMGRQSSLFTEGESAEDVAADLSTLFSDDVSVEGSGTVGDPLLVEFDGPELAGTNVPLMTGPSNVHIELVQAGDPGSDPVNAVFAVTIDADGGTYAIEDPEGGDPSDPVAYDASAATVQTAARSVYGAGNVDVAWSGVPGEPYYWTMKGDFAGMAVDPPEIDDAELTLGGGGSPYINDSFTAADGTQAYSRATDSAHTWLRYSASGPSESGADGKFPISSNHLVPNGGLNACSLVADAGESDGICEVTVVQPGLPSVAYGRYGLAARASGQTSPASAFCIIFYVIFSTSGVKYTIYLKKADNSGWVIVDENIPLSPATAAGAYHLQLTMSGEDLNFKITKDGSEVLLDRTETGADNQYTTNTFHGLYCDVGDGYSENGISYLDDYGFSAEGLGGGSGPGSAIITTDTPGDPGGDGALNTIQSVWVDEASGEWYLVGGYVYTGNLAYNSNAATNQAALEALDPIGSGNVSASGGGVAGSPMLFEFISAKAATDMPQLVVDASLLTGGSVILTPLKLAAVVGRNEIQLVQVDQFAIAGTLRLLQQGLLPTGGINWNDDAAAWTTKLVAAWGAGNALATGSPAYMQIEYKNDLGFRTWPLLTIDQDLLQLSASGAMTALDFQPTGPGWWNNRLNWTLEHVPTSGEIAVLGSGKSSILYGLAQSSVCSLLEGTTVFVVAGDFVVGQALRLRAVESDGSPGSYPAATCDGETVTLAGDVDYFVISSSINALGNQLLQLSTAQGGQPIEFSEDGDSGTEYRIGVRLVALQQYARYSGQVGWPRRDSGGDWVPGQRYLCIDLEDSTDGRPNFEVGIGSGEGLKLGRFDFGTAALDGRILRTGSASNEPAVQLLNSNIAASELLLIAGQVGLAIEPTERAALKKLTVMGGQMTVGNVDYKRAEDYAQAIRFVSSQANSDTVEARMR